MTHICPTCEGDFETLHGMVSHHGLIHPNQWEDRFWLYVNTSDPGECWEWTGTTQSGGYGWFSKEGRQRLAHRLAFVIENGDPENYVLHHCDNPLCCNPGHLYDGRQKDNVDDMWRRGRANPKTGPGEESNRSVLSRSEVEEIRRKYASTGTSYKKLASEYPVETAQIGRIIRGESWGHIQ